MKRIEISVINPEDEQQALLEWAARGYRLALKLACHYTLTCSI